MNKWEYDVVNYYTPDLSDVLNTIGYNGWEVVQVERRIDYEQKDYYHIIAKRCLQGQTTDGGSKESSPESSY